MIGRALFLLATLAALATCASERPPPLVVAARRSPVRLEGPPPVFPAEPPAPPPAAPAAAPARSPLDDVVKELGVEKSALVWSAAKKSFAVVVPGNPNAPRTRRPPPATIALYAPTGQRRATFRALAAGEISELRFLGEDQLYYRLPVKPARKRIGRPRRSRKGAVPELPPPLRYVIQATKEGAPPVACTGWRFVFSPAGDHVSYVGGDGAHQRLYVDGQAVYPRRGATLLANEPAWAQDNLGLATIESGAHRRLVVLVEFDNPTGDNTWPLPPEAEDPSLHVFWAGPSKLVVGPSLTKPVFAASFHRDPPPVVSLPGDDAGTAPARP